MKPSLFRTIPTMWAAPAVQYTDPYPTVNTGWFHMQMLKHGKEPEWIGYYNVNSSLELLTGKYTIL
jgi:hypothetical protein